MADKDELLLQLLQCKSQIEQVKRAREECSQQMQSCTLELDAINDIISKKTSSTKVAPEGSQLDHIVKAMVSQGTLHENELITDEMSDDAVKKLRDDLTKKAILYLEQERTQKNKIEQDSLETLETNLHNVEQQLQDHMVTSNSKVEVDEEDIDGLTAELINLRRRVQEYAAMHTRTTYQGEWAVNTYEPYQMQALSIVRNIVEELVEDVLDKVGASPVEYMQQLEKLLLQSSKEQLAEEAILLLTHQIIMDIGMKWLNEVVNEMCLEIAQHMYKAASLAGDVAEELIIMQLPVKKDKTRTDSNRNEMLKKIFHQMKTDRQQKHTQLLTQWTKDGVTKETVDYKKSSKVTEIVLPQDVLLRNSAKLTSGDDSEEEKVWKTLSIKLQESKSFKNISAVSVSPNREYIAVGTAGQILVYDNNKMLPVSEEIASKEKFNFLHLSWSLDSMYLLSVSSEGTLECWHIFTGQITSSGLSVSKLIIRIPKDDCQLKGDLNLSADAASLPHIIIAKFYPSFSMLGIQPWVMMGLSSGDIIKCQVMPDIHLMMPEVQPVLKFGNDFSAELFRGHEAPVVTIVFSDFTGGMFSLDVTYHLFVWDYSRDGFSGYGWYMPQKIYKLNFELAMYSPIPDTNVKIKYDDKHEKSQKRKTNAEKQRIYRKALADLHSVQKSHVLWKELTFDNVLKQFYVPQETQDTDILCHIAVKDKDQQLLSYVIRSYQTIKVSPVKLLTCYQTFTGKELIFQVLYKHELVAPQGVKISLDLTTPELTKSVNIDRKIIDNSNNPSNLPYLLYKYINQ